MLARRSKGFDCHTGSHLKRLCAALVLASREVFAAWREIPLRILSPINARPLLDAGESCGVFLGATTSVFDKQTIDFWDIARDARIDVAANRTTEKIAAQLSEFRRVVGNGGGGDGGRVRC